MSRYDRDDLPLQGRSLKRLLDGREDPSPPPVYLELALAGEAGPRHARAVAEERYKLVRVEGSDAVQLYDLDSDPGESSNVAAENPELVAWLGMLLVRQRGWLLNRGPGGSPPGAAPGAALELRQELVAAGEQSEHLPQPPAWRAARPSVQGASYCPRCRPVPPRPGVRSTPPRRVRLRGCRHASSG